MSSENINITRHNYEEYFLLYVDNELSAAERMAVENFVSSHPDLREELELLMQTSVLHVPESSLGDKSFLMAESMKVNAIDDSLLLYLDNELSGTEKSKVEKALASDSSLQLQYNLLLQTKLPKEKVVYPNKAELYRKTEKAGGVYWLRIAAAVIVIAAIALVYVMNGDGTSTLPVVAGVNPKTEKTVQLPQEQEQVAAVETEDKNSTVEIIREKKNKDLSVPVREDIIHEENKDQIAYSPAEIITDPVDTNNNDAVVSTDTRAVDAGTDPKQNLATQDVTEPNTNTYNSTDVVTTPGNYQFTDDKGGSVKGLLRKATRFIEKRTGVNPVNDDDELLIGVVAIKLK